MSIIKVTYDHMSSSHLWSPLWFKVQHMVPFSKVGNQSPVLKSFVEFWGGRSPLSPYIWAFQYPLQKFLQYIIHITDNLFLDVSSENILWNIWQEFYQGWTLSPDLLKNLRSHLWNENDDGCGSARCAIVPDRKTFCEQKFSPAVVWLCVQHCVYNSIQ